jgi:hypothetical protein
MDKPVTGKEVYAALQNDPGFRMAEDELGFLRPMVEDSPEILANLLDQPFTMENFLKAQIAFKEAVINHAGTDEFVADLLGAAVDLARDLIEEFPQALAEAGVPEEHVILGSQVGLWPPAAALYRAGTLTIGELLRIQPGVIILSK